MRFVSLVALLLFVSIADAATWIVSNVPGFPANYNNLQTCITAAAANDVIIVQGSGISYGDIVVDKPITIMGPGYFLAQNPETQVNLASAKLNSVHFKKTAGGSLMQGMEITGHFNHGAVAGRNYFADYSGVLVDTCSVTLISNRMAGVFLSLAHSNGSMVKNNFLHAVVESGGCGGNQYHNNIVFAGMDVLQATVKNNLIDCDFSGEGGGYEGCLLLNNIVGPRGGTYPYGINNSSCANNIFVGDNPLGLNSAGNWVSQNTDSLFIGYPVQGNHSNDGRYRLKAGSIAVGNGANGDDIGPYGGISPYKLSGISLHPNIWFVNMPVIGTTGSGLQVRIKANAND